MIELNPGQKKAAETLVGPVVVDAGAGSGKTRALTRRFVNAIAPPASIEGWDPALVEQVVAITFTDKAAGELAERIRESLRASDGLEEEARRVDVAWISTIHGFCSRILRENALVAGLDPQFAVADTVTAGELAEEAFESVSRAAIERHPAAAQLFGDYGYERVFAAVTGIRRDLIKRGVSAAALHIEPAPNAHGLLSEARIVLRQSAERLRQCDDRRPSVASRVGVCQEVTARLESIDTRTTDAAEIGLAVWDELRVLPKTSPVTKGEAAEILADLCEQRAQLRRQALTLWLRPMAEALVDLANDYEEAFSAAKAERSLLDFDDLQTKALDLLTRHPEIAAGYQDAFRLVMVDEFQDTDSLQLDLVKAVGGHNLCTVGDERQSIYRFRGAEVEVYREYREECKAEGAPVIAFTRNYRSHTAVLDFVNRVFSSSEYFDGSLLKLEHGRKEPEEPLLPDDEPRIELLVVDRPSGTTEAGREREAAEVADRFAALRARGLKASDMAVLLRSWSKARVFAEALRARGFAVIVGGGDFLTRPEVLLVRSLLAAISNPLDEIALITVMASPLGGVPADRVWAIAQRRTEGETSLWQALRDEAETAEGDVALCLDRVIRALENASGRAGMMPLSEITLRAVTELGYDLVLLSQGPEGKQAFVNVLKLARLADVFEETGQSGIAAFVEHLDAKEKLGDRESVASLADDGSPAVRIMSIHGSKGLEFPVVAVVGLADGSGSDRRCIRTGWRRDERRLRVALKAPSEYKDDVDRTAWFDALDADEKAAEDDEEKRLAYVATTRAEEYLLVSGGIPLDKLSESRTILASVVRSIGALDLVEPGVDEVADVGGFTLRVRCVDAAPLPIDESPERAVVDVLSESDLVVMDGHAERPHEPRVDDVSFSSLKLYETCPRRYWSQRIAGFGYVVSGEEDLQGEPVAIADEPLAFGSAVHAALEEAANGRTPSDDRLDSLARSFGLTDDGRRRLKTAIEAAMRSNAWRRAHDVGGVRAELPFSLTIGEGGDTVRLGGSIDLYARRADEAIILDYKTGTSGGRQDICERYGLQATCYALAALAQGAPSVEALYIRPEVPDGADIETTTFGPYAPDDRPALEAEVLRVVSAIRAGEFPPRPSEHACSECRIPRGLCPEAWEPECT